MILNNFENTFNPGAQQRFNTGKLLTKELGVSQNDNTKHIYHIHYNAHILNTGDKRTHLLTPFDQHFINT